MTGERHPAWRFLPLALIVAGLGGGLGVWIDASRTPAPSAVPELNGPLNSPELSEGSGRPLDQETARAVIVGLEALTEMRLKDAPAQREAYALLASIQRFNADRVAESGGPSTALPLCPQAPHVPGGQAWTPECSEAWDSSLGWSPKALPGQGIGEPPRTLCRYMVLPDERQQMQAFALCDEHNDGDIEIYQVAAQGPVLELDEPELSLAFAYWSGDVQIPDSLASDAD